MSFAAKPMARIVSLWMMAYLAFSTFPAGPAAAQESGGLAAAQNLFEFADYEAALASVNELIGRGGLSNDDARDARVLKARCQLELGRTSEAQQSFCEAIGIDPSWRPDPLTFKTTEIDAFNRAIQTCGESQTKPRDAEVEGEKKGGGALKYILGGAALVTGGVLLFALGGGDSTTPEPVVEDLPNFPDPPTE